MHDYEQLCLMDLFIRSYLCLSPCALYVRDVQRLRGRHGTFINVVPTHI
jgi:hypothetical protein